jgi:hypothetical protein
MLGVIGELGLCLDIWRAVRWELRERYGDLGKTEGCTANTKGDHGVQEGWTNLEYH